MTAVPGRLSLSNDVLVMLSKALNAEGESAVFQDLRNTSPGGEDMQTLLCHSAAGSAPPGAARRVNTGTRALLPAPPPGARSTGGQRPPDGASAGGQD